MINRISQMRQRRDEGGFTLIELLVVIIILGVLSAVVVFAVRGTGDKGQAAAYATDAKTVRTAQEAYCAQFGTYGTEDQLVAKKFLSEPSVNTDVSLGSGGVCGTGATSSYSLTTAAATVNIAANADQWITSDTGSGPGYDSSAFSYPLNSNLYDPLIIMNSDYTISGGLAASWERIPVAADRAAFTSAQTPIALPLPPRAYSGDRPFPAADTWRFHLRTGVTFQDGQAFNADDVIWTWRDRQALSGSQSSGANTLSYTMRLGGTAPAQYDSVEKIDNFTVDITPTAQNLRFPEQVLHPKGAIAPVLRDGSGNPLPAGFGAVTGLSSPRTIGRHLDGSTGGLPSGTGAYLGITRAASTTTNGSPTVTGVNFVVGDVGRTVIGTGVPAGATITAVATGASATLSANATASGTVTLTLAASSASTPLVTGTPQGTGPFKYVSYNPTNPQGGGSASFASFTGYWGTPKAQVQGMKYTFIADPAVRTAGLQSGQYDMAIDLNPLDVATVEGSGKRVVKAPYGRNSLIYVNKVVKTSPAVLDLTKVPPATPPNYTFNIGTDPAVRKASSLALDRGAYVTAIYAGEAQPGRWMSPPGILGSYQSLVPPLSTDLALARTTLDNDGWTCANGGPQGAAGAGTPCAVNEIRKWNGDARFTIGRQLDLYMIGISLVPQTGYDLMAAQMKLVGINLITQRGTCDSAIICPDGSVGRGQMYNTSMWDFDLELPNQNDANAAFLPVLRQACLNESTTFRFAPADGTNGIGPSVTDTAALGGGTYPFGKTPCRTGSPNTTPAVLGPMDTTWVPQSLAATTPAPNQEAAANMMAILVNQSATNVVIPVIGEYRIYGMSSKVNLGDPHPSQTSQRWVSLTMLF